MKNYSICTLIGVIGAAFAELLGGWDSSLTTLLIFMAIDYLTGLAVAGIFHTSTKTETGTLESKAGWKGLCRKCMTLMFVLIGTRIDKAIGTTYVRDAVCIAFITNELISIVENAGLMGLPIPEVIIKAIDVLKKRNNNNNNDGAA